MVDLGTDIGEMLGIVQPNVQDLGELFLHHLNILQQSLQIILFLCLKIMIEFLTTMFISIGEIGIMTITGTIKSPIETMKAMDGIVIINLVMIVIKTGIMAKVGIEIVI